MYLLIAIPSLDFMHVEFVRSLINLTERLSDEGIKHEVKIVSGTLVYIARDQLAAYAVENEFTHVLWLDSDMIFNDDILDDLMFCEKDFVAGIFHTRRPPHCSCIFKNLDPIDRYTSGEYPNEPFKIAGCGFGCILMTTEIIKAVRDRFVSCFLPARSLGEDLAFCARVAHLGFEMWAEPTARVGHIGHIAIYPEDEERYYSKILGVENVKSC